VLHLDLVPHVGRLELEPPAVDVDPTPAGPRLGDPVRDGVVVDGRRRSRLVDVRRADQQRAVAQPAHAVEVHLPAGVAGDVAVVDGVAAGGVEAEDEAVVARARDVGGPGHDRVVVQLRPRPDGGRRPGEPDPIRVVAKVAAAVHEVVRAAALEDVRRLVPVEVALPVSLPPLRRADRGSRPERERVRREEAVGDDRRAGGPVDVARVLVARVVEEPQGPVVVTERMAVDRPAVDERALVPLEGPERTRRTGDADVSRVVVARTRFPAAAAPARPAPRRRDVHVEDAALVDDLGGPQIRPRPAPVRRLERVTLEHPVDEVRRPVDGDAAAAGRLARVVEEVRVEVLDDERVAVVVAGRAADDRIAEGHGDSFAVDRGIPV